MQLMERQRGLTLVELVVALAIVAVGASLTAPAITKMVANYRVRQAADGMLAALTQARTEAIRRNTDVSFKVAGSEWTVMAVAKNEVLAASPAGETSGLVVTSDVTPASITFKPTGVVDTSQPHLGEVTISTTGDATARRISVFGGGLIRMCDPKRTTAGDPRVC